MDHIEVPNPFQGNASIANSIDERVTGEKAGTGAPALASEAGIYRIRQHGQQLFAVGPAQARIGN
ncbi:hypothetical protein SLIQ_07340 [Serratia liquefaciens FK01]|nr:hypothetical protein SLIQ_07340 [Serratia liquefaciens FK01]